MSSITLGSNSGKLIEYSDNNIFIGNASSGSCNTTGSCNIFIGHNAGSRNTTGYNNIFIGFCAGFFTTTGNSNNFIGAFAGRNNTGVSNNFFGTSAGMSNTSGNGNSFFGSSSGSNNTTGLSNSFFGSSSGSNNTTGCDNTFLGTCAGILNTTGTKNTFIGCAAGWCSNAGSNNIAIGPASGSDAVYNFGTTGASNVIVLGNNSHTAIYAKVTTITSSDARDKTNIIPIPVGKEFLRQLNPVRFNWKDRKTGKVTDPKPRYGFLAQNIADIEPDPKVILDDHDPENLKISESMIVPVLVQVVKELLDEIDILNERLLALEKIKGK